ncbi:guanine nucleotide binding protein, alpha subunit [Mycena rebaudengoi]|nr:guanine nucleotide binding protein, alpha subunit [Mycena rebaudengoi]
MARLPPLHPWALNSAGTAQSLGSPEEQAESRRIDEILQKDRKEYVYSRHSLKILLLGSSNSGRSIWMHQMKMIREEYTDEQRRKFTSDIHAYVIRAFRNIFTSHPELFSPEVMANKQQILLDGTEDRLTTEIAEAISALWGDESVQDALSASVMDASLAYYLESLDRLSAPEYIPTAADILRVASRETPPIEQVSLISPTSIPRSVVCVRHSRDGIRKWLHCFDGYSLIFMVNLDHYDELERMRESMAYFEYVSNSIWFRNKSPTLLLCNYNLLVTKLAKVPLSSTFPDYMGGDDPKAAVKYLLNRFKALHQDHEPVCVHVVDIFDPQHVKATLGAVTDAYLRSTMTMVCMAMSH